MVGSATVPSILHEALLLLFRNRPSLAPELLRDVLAVPLPPYTEVRLEDATLTQVVPTEYHADLVVLLYRGAPVFGIIVEAQLTANPEKHFTWPLYAAALRARLRCPTCVLVVTPDASVARWASQPIETGQPGCPFVPVVLGPGAVPLVTQPAEAERAPELAVLSVLAHGKEERGVEVALAAIGIIERLDTERARLYNDLVYAALNEAARRALESLMKSGSYELQYPEAAEMLRELAQKIQKLRGEGRVEGRAEGKIEALLQILAVRGLAVSDADRARILACADPTQLDRWIERAVRASSVADVLD